MTIYTKGAQIVRKANVEFEKGITIIKLAGLSPYVNKESVKIEGDEVVARVFDQIPVSNNKDISVEGVGVSEAKMDKDSGKFERELGFKPK